MLLLLCAGEQLFGSDTKHKTLKISVKDADSLRVVNLCNEMIYYNRVMNDAHLADSVGEMAVEVATATFRPSLIMMAYNTYLEHTDLTVYQNKAMQYALAAEQLSTAIYDPQKELGFFVLYSPVRVYHLVG